MKTIYFIINDISMPGGLARVTLNLYNELMKNYSYKYEIKIISATISDGSFKVPNNIVNLELEPLHHLNKIKKLFWYLLFITKINKYLRVKQPDIVIGVGVLFNLCLSLYLNKTYKIYATEHTSYENNSKILILFRKILYKRINKVISLTKKDALKYSKFHNDVIVIPNFTNFTNISNYSTLKNKKLLYVGRFTKIKGVDILIDIMIDFFKLHKEWKLVMYGEGPLKIIIEEKIIKYNLQNNIFINNPISNIEIAYLNSDIYLMTSRNEGFPMVLLEAKAFGLPIVGFDCPTGPSEIIKNNKDGFLIPMKDNKMFLKKLVELVDNIDLRKKMSQRAREDIKEFYPDKIIKQWEKILDE